MGPSTSRAAYSPKNKSLTASRQILRKPGRKSKLKIAEEKYGSSKKKQRMSLATFQKKLVVFECMGPDASKSFTRSEKLILVRGLLPVVSVNISECDLRKEICDIIKNSKDGFRDMDPSDFDFINNYEWKACLSSSV